MRLRTRRFIRKAVVKRALHCFPDLQAIYLFGSWGTKWQDKDSDIDIAILAPKKEGERTFEQLSDEIYFRDGCARLAGTKSADVIELRTLRDFQLAEDIVTYGTLLYEADPKARNEYEAYAVAAFKKQQDEREAEIAAAKARGEKVGAERTRELLAKAGLNA